MNVHQQGFTADPTDENELWKLYVDWNGYTDAPANRIGQLAAFIGVAHPKLCQEYINTDKRCWEENCGDDEADVATPQDAPYDTCPATYEIWASDQSNSVADQSKLGVAGSFLWIFDSKSVNGQLQGGIDATPLPCTPGATEGPCDIMDMFPSNLVANGSTLGNLGKFGRLHGVIKVRTKLIEVAPTRNNALWHCNSTAPKSTRILTDGYDAPITQTLKRRIRPIDMSMQTSLFRKAGILVSSTPIQRRPLLCSVSPRSRRIRSDPFT